MLPADSDQKNFIIIKNARVHNLKNLSVAIPRNRLIVITGLSGSGKSSLAFDTLYAEGQRRYVESLSSYARQFIGRMNKPDVDYIHGMAPAIAIEQKVNTRNPRSTVGTSTEIYDYLKLLYARAGRTFSPVSGLQVKRSSVSDVVDYISLLKKGSSIIISAPVRHNPGRTMEEELKVLLQKGFTRISLDKNVQNIEDVLASGTFREGKGKKKSSRSGNLHVIIDRVLTGIAGEDEQSRIADSVQTAFSEGNGECFIETSSAVKTFSTRFEADGLTFEEPSVNLFSFNNPYGACRKCEGFGQVLGIDEDLVIPNKNLSVYESAIACWRGERMKEWNEKLLLNAYHFNFPVHKPWYRLSEEQKKLLWKGNKYFMGLNAFFHHLEEKSYKIQYRVMLSRYKGRTTCPECKGTRLRKEAAFVKINGRSVSDLVLLPVRDLLSFFKELRMDKHEQQVAKRILTEIKSRLEFLENVGLGYLTLNRLSNTLSGGESQRINLATSLGSSLVGSMYILDEPSIGLHPRDTGRLISVIKSLRELGNTVIVVEHDEEIIRSADQLIDIGPGAGSGGGRLVFQGSIRELVKERDSLTAQYLTGAEKINTPPFRRKQNGFIEIRGARENNLKNINVKIPLGIMTVVSGVSGSGKTSLIKRILYPALKKIYGGYSEQSGRFDSLEGDIDSISAVEMVDQNPIGKSSRSNPVTYIKAYDEIRNLFAQNPLAKTRGFKPSHFSFNIEGGRCDVCEGEGEVTIEMQFMADLHLLCESCSGKRFKQEVLEIEYKGRNIADVLGMTVDDALSFFAEDDNPQSHEQKIISRLKPLSDVGLGYVQLGQSSGTLSGGEAQRVKLAFFLGKANEQKNALFIFDEPTTGLHFHDIRKLIESFNALIAQGHTLLIVEHNPHIIKSADWVIDMGPEGGEEGGNIVFEGTPEDLSRCKKSHTGSFLRFEKQGTTAS